MYFLERKIFYVRQKAGENYLFLGFKYPSCDGGSKNLSGDNKPSITDFFVDSGCEKFFSEDEKLGIKEYIFGDEKLLSKICQCDGNGSKIKCLL